MHSSKLYTISGAAKKVGLARQTVQRAVAIGRIPSYPTKDGYPLVLLKDVRLYLANPLPPGPRPKVGRPKPKIRRKR